ncbi:MAG: Hsp70 family protein [bacterium]|nr:Hsp70 family protein [bacterium]
MKIIGIDLGTTNSAASWTELAENAQVTDFPILQLTHPGTPEPRQTLPSFLYLPGPHELPPGSTEMLWETGGKVTGWLAREQSAKVPHRVISSAKSWLCHQSINRRSAILPWKSPDEVPKMSPVEVSAAYLQHIKEAWNFENPEEPFTEQKIIITVPASFDTIARELTAEAAKGIGIKDLTLLEEPQAAFYAWLTKREDWRKEVKVGDKILVCDIGGGTTDFSLITVGQEDGNLTLDRTAVGEHILLGGDNMDLTLGMAVQQRLKKERSLKLDTWQLQVLTHGCRTGKEQLLQEYADDDWPITIPGRGSSLIGGSIRAELKRTETEQIIIEGFFPKCPAVIDEPRSKRLGLTELGLPFEQDAAVTRHLARFLGRHKEEGTDAPIFCPTAVLFNGGVLKAPVIRQRLLEVLNGWLAEFGHDPVRVLEGADLDLAVSRGAAAFGLAACGQGIRIRGGTNRAYYLGIESSMPAIPGFDPPIHALCVAPLGMEEGTSSDVPDREFGLVVGEPVEFKFLGSTVRSKDKIGDYIEDWEDDIEELAVIGLTLTSDTAAPGTIVPVRLQSHVTEVGTLEVWCLALDNSGRWKLQFELRAE